MKIKLVLAFALATYSQLLAQEIIRYSSISTSTELCSNQVHSIAIDNEGKKWFGAVDGLSVFDGTTWTSYDLPPTNVLPSPPVAKAVVVDSEGDIWVMRNLSPSVRKFDGTTWTTFDEVKGAGYSIAIDEEGNKWFGTSAGVSKFDGTNWTFYDTTDGLVNNSVFAIAIDGAGMKWFGTPGGVSKFDGTTWTNYTTADGLVNNGVREIANDGSGNLWFGTNGGVSKFNGTTWTNYTTADGLVNNTVNAITIDAAGNKWFGAANGISKFDDVSWSTYTTTDGLVNNAVNAIVTDEDGNIWMATLGGVSKFTGTTWANYISTGEAYGLHNSVNSIAADHAGTKWFATNGGVSKFDDTTWTRYTTKDGLVYNGVLTVAVDAKNNKWFGTNGGVSKFDGTTWTNYTVAEGLANNTVNAVAIDDEGNKWFGTAGGVSKFNGTTWTTYTTAHGLAANNVISIAVDPKGNKWFGTDLGGLSKFDGTTWTTYTKSIAGFLGSNKVDAIVIDSRGNKWIAGNGVSQFDDTTWVRTLEGDYIWPLIMTLDASDRQWIGSLGVFLMMDGPSKKSYSIPVSYDGGLVSAITVDNSGNIWTGNGTGVYKYVVCPEVPTTPVITSHDGLLESSAAVGNQWYVDNIKIAGEVKDTYRPGTGSYYSIVASEGCTSEKSNTVSFAITGIGDPLIESTVNVTPNPTTGLLHVILGKHINGKVAVRVYNSGGILMDSWEQKTQHGELEVDLRKQQPGLYIIHLDDGATTRALKVVRN